MSANLHHHPRSGNSPAPEQLEVEPARSPTMDSVAHERALLPFIV
jgi:hypothetical protein